MVAAAQPDLPRLEVEFLTSAPDLRQCPPADRPEVAFAGRSNSGKSSVLNRLTGNRRTAKVSKTPGRTQLLNFFDCRLGGRLVDLPGYGYAKANRSAQAEWQNSVNRYLSRRDCLVGVVLVMDIRHPLQSFDTELLEWARESEMPVQALLNKADKLKYGAQQKVVNSVKRQLANHPHTNVQAFSAMAGTGAPALIDQLTEWLSGPLDSELVLLDPGVEDADSPES